MNPTDNILSLIHFDVCFSLQELQSQIRNKQLEILYIDCNRDFFNANAFAKYLSEVLIKNTFTLKDILNKCCEVIKLNNIDFIELEENRYSSFNFIKIIDEKIVSSYKDEGQENLIIPNRKDYKMYLSEELAENCNQLVNMITAAYPRLKDSIKQYQETDKTNGKTISEQYIKLSLVKKLNDIESKMEGIISTFTKIQCAAWVDLLFNDSPSYFQQKYHEKNVVSCTAFAKARYKLNIKVQLQSSKKNALLAHKELLKHHLNPN